MPGKYSPRGDGTPPPPLGCHLGDRSSWRLQGPPCILGDCPGGGGGLGGANPPCTQCRSATPATPCVHIQASRLHVAWLPRGCFTTANPPPNPGPIEVVVPLKYNDDDEESKVLTPEGYVPAHLLIAHVTPGAATPTAQPPLTLSSWSKSSRAADGAPAFKRRRADDGKNKLPRGYNELLELMPPQVRARVLSFAVPSPPPVSLCPALTIFLLFVEVVHTISIVIL